MNSQVENRPSSHLCHERKERIADATGHLQVFECAACLESRQRSRLLCLCFPPALPNVGPDFEFGDCQPQGKLRPVFGEISAACFPQ